MGIIDQLFADADPLNPDVEDVYRMMEREEYSPETGADHFAEAATRRYAEGEINHDELWEVLEDTQRVARNGAGIGVLKEYIDRLGAIEDLQVNTPRRDMYRENMEEMLEEYENEYDVIVSAGGSSLSFADEIAEENRPPDVSLAVDRGLVKEAELEGVEGDSHVLEYEDGQSAVEFMGRDIEDRDVLVVNDYGVSEGDRERILDAVEDRAGEYTEVHVTDFEEGSKAEEVFN